MATALSMKSLEELCLTHVTMTLEQYSTDTLSLLPKDFRLQLLHKIPIVDVCRLEDTDFTSGIDMESVWMALHKEYISEYRFGSCLDWRRLDWRESIFWSIFIAIVRGERPFGYYDVPSRGAKRRSWISDEDRPVSEQKVDFVNLLVAVKCEIPVETPKVNANLIKINRSRYGPVNHTMTRHEVTLVKGPIPPGKAYHETCRARQLVPPRYTKFSLKETLTCQILLH